MAKRSKKKTKKKKDKIEGNEIKNKEALANPEVLKEYTNIKELND